MLTPLLTNQSLKNRNIEHLIKTPTVDRLGKLITGRKKGLVVQGKTQTYHGSVLLFTNLKDRQNIEPKKD